MKKELETAAKIQRMLIPDVSVLPKNERYRVYAYYLPHYELGGDLYDFGMISSKEFYFAIADVSGKGLSAALLMSNFQANLRAQFSSNIRLEEIIKNLNENVIRSSKGAHFITMFLGKYNFARRRLIYVNAGHHPPILYDKVTKKISLLRKGCVGIGMLDEIPEIEVGKVKLSNPSKLLLYTDGVSEISSYNREDFGFRKIQQIVASDLDIEQTIKKIINVLRLSKDNPKLFDDVTLLGFDFN
jgi:sigma-B regulation protein RsbU (phosphoserine phosphatase)